MNYDDYCREFGSELLAPDVSPSPACALSARRRAHTTRYEIGPPRRFALPSWRWPIAAVVIAGALVAWLTLPAPGAARIEERTSVARAS